MDILTTEANRYLALSIANSTHNIYAAAMTSYQAFCYHDMVVPFPLSEATLIRYCSAIANRLKYSSIKTYLAGIQFHATVRGFQQSIAAMRQLYYVLRGIRRAQALIAGRPVKQPITFVHLAMLYDVVSVQFSRHDAAMMHSAMSLAFFGMLRVSEYTSSHSHSYAPESTLLVEDAYIIESTLHISLKSSKTDPFRVGSVVRLVQTSSRFCPVMAFRSFSRFRGSQLGPLYTYQNGSFLTRSRLSTMLQRIFPAAHINTHSFRIGGASAASSAGIPDSSIKILGRWSSDAFLRYLRFSDDDIANFLTCMSHER